MSRRCHQEGHVRLRDDVKRPYWQGLYRVRSEGQPGGKWKSENLGYKDEITKRQAQRRFQKIISKMESEIVSLPRSVMTVNAYVDDHYIPEFVGKRKPSTRLAYLQILKARIVPTLGAMELDHVTRRDVQLLINRLHSEGRARHTCDHVRTVIRSLFRQAIRDEYVTANPATLIQMPEADGRIPIEVPSQEKIQELLDTLKEPYGTLAWFVLVTGCRIGEALGLKWGAINVEDRLVWFLTASYHGHMHLTKGHRSNGPVYLSEAEIQRLREFRSLSPDATENDLVFPHPEHPGKAMTEWHALRVGLKPAGRKVGIELTWHQLRHWTGTMLYRAGVPVKVIQARLGHSKWETTADWYVEFSREGERKAAEVISHLLRKVLP